MQVSHSGSAVPQRGGDYVSHCKAAVQRDAGKQRFCRRRDQLAGGYAPPRWSGVIKHAVQRQQRQWRP